MSLFSRILRMARTPQGKRLMSDAGRYARSPQGRRQLDNVRRQLTSRGRRPPR